MHRNQDNTAVLLFLGSMTRRRHLEGLHLLKFNENRRSV